MILVDGRAYKDGRGGEAWIGGACRDHPAWVWSVQGNWYERATGRAIGYRRVEGTKDVWENYVREPSPHDLVRDVGDWHR